MAKRRFPSHRPPRPLRRRSPFAPPPRKPPQQTPPATESPSEQPEQSAPSERPGRSAPSERSGQNAPSERSGQNAPSERSGQIASSERSGQNAPSELASLEQKIHDLAKPRPIYTPRGVRPVHALRYDWTGWLSEESKAPFPPNTFRLIEQTAPLWEADGIRLDDFRHHRGSLQLLFECGPDVPPVYFASRVKGRLQHALRQGAAWPRFSRKVSVRTLGENVRAAVEGYLGKQVRKEGFVDPRFRARLSQYTIEDETVDLAEPTLTNSGRYWYNIHLVFVTAGRRRTGSDEIFTAIRDGSLRIAKKKGYLIKSLSVMPDHTHVALRGAIDDTPEDIALAFMNNLAFLLGRDRVWKDEYYVGTFSEYRLDVIREVTGTSSCPARQARGGRE